MDSIRSEYSVQRVEPNRDGNDSLFWDYFAVLNPDSKAAELPPLPGTEGSIAGGSRLSPATPPPPPTVPSASPSIVPVAPPIAAPPPPPPISAPPIVPAHREPAAPPAYSHAKESGINAFSVDANPPAKSRSENRASKPAASDLNSLDFLSSLPTRGQPGQTKNKTKPSESPLDLQTAKDLDDETEDPKAALARFSFQETPSWLVSMIVHVAIILLLALIPLHEQIGNSIGIYAGFGGGEEGQDDVLSSFDIDSDSLSIEPAATEVISSETLSIADAPALTASTTDIAKSLNLNVPMSIRNGLSGRSGTMKGALLAAYGGTAGTEDAVSSGLAWLAQNQLSDGSWSLEGPYSNGSVNENKSSATAMALLAFMGAGNTHREGQYADRVARGIAFLTREQDADGFFAKRAIGNQRTYAQAQCTIAFCELYGMTGDSSVREHAERAIKYAVMSQDEAGGWRYTPRNGSDTSVTGWYVMALVSARMAGLNVDSEVLEKVHRFLDSVQRSVGQARSGGEDRDGEAYAYQSYSSPTVTMTAEGMLCRLYLGWKTTDPRIMRGVDYLLRDPIRTEIRSRNFYYWYYATTTLHHIGGSPWRTWNETMKVKLPELQVHAGKERGSWSPDGDPHGAAGGRLYTTCLALYCLESYYRHLPLSEMAERAH